MKVGILFLVFFGSFSGLAQQSDTTVSPYELQLADGYRPLLHQRHANQVLGGWSVLSMGAGIVQLLSPNPFVKAMGLQNLIWGAVDGGIALYGSHHLATTTFEVEDLADVRAHFRRILLINSLLDIGYLVLGFGLLKAANSKWHGHGQGILIQGGFLLLFDGVNFALTF